MSLVSLSALVLGMGIMRRHKALLCLLLHLYR